MKPLEELFKREAFDEGLIVREGDKVYSVYGLVKLELTAMLAEEGWITVVVMNDMVTIAERFWPTELLMRTGFEAVRFRNCVNDIYFVYEDYVCYFINKLVRKYGLEKTDIVKRWCEAYKRGKA